MDEIYLLAREIARNKGGRCLTSRRGGWDRDKLCGKEDPLSKELKEEQGI